MAKYYWDKNKKEWVDHENSALYLLKPRVYIRGQIEPFVSPINGKVIDGRTQLREHNRANDVVDRRELKGHKFETPKLPSARNDVVEAFKRNTGRL